MRLVGLISGGKDSLYNMLQCIAAGHEIVAVANIEPETKEELNSYMYQSVGHELITLIAGALCLPIFRQKTKGKALCKSRSYTKTQQDEVEDLALLLNKVKKSLNIDGVSVGAIASDYQRTRVENVCARLGLKSFAYLWRRNQMELLQEMIDAELDAIIIKVACIGLNPKHLGMSIQEMQPHLLDLNKKYGVNVCGEGGEYETVTLDCPLFHRSITIAESEKIILTDDPFAPVAYLNVKNASLNLKSWESDGSSVSLQQKINIIRETIKGPYAYVLDCVDELSEAIFPQKTPLVTEDIPFPFEPTEDNSPTRLDAYWKQHSLKPPSNLQVSSSKSLHLRDTSVVNLNFSSGWCCVGNVTAGTISDALESAQKHLQRMNYDFQDVAFINLFVRDLSEFTKMNKTYSQYMPEINPPARACVETILPPDVGVLVILMAHTTVSKCKRVVASCNLLEDRQTMHVQSISHWAPANIGPYSQCVAIGGIYYVAGQIPLIPGTMEILNKPIFHQCRLALRHVLRILQATSEDLHYSNILLATCYVTSAGIAADVVPLWTYIAKASHTPVAVVVVSELPKKAQLEWEVIACALSNPIANEELQVIDDFELHIKRCFYKDSCISSLVCSITHTKKSNGKSPTKSTGKCCKFVTSKGLTNAMKNCIEILKKDLNLTAPLCVLKLYYRAGDTAVSNILKEIIPTFVETKIIATAIPVLAFNDPDTFFIISGFSS